MTFRAEVHADPKVIKYNDDLITERAEDSADPKVIKYNDDLITERARDVDAVPNPIVAYTNGLITK